MTERTFRQQMTEGVKWVGISRLLLYFLQLVVTVILARIVPPSSFGALSAALVFANFTVIFNELGFMSAVIQHKDLKDAHVVTAFWACALLGFIFLGAGIMAAPYVAVFFDNPLVSKLVVLFAFQFCVDSFGIIQEAVLRRRMDFKKLMSIDITANVAFGITAVSLAFGGAGILAMGWGFLVSSLLRVSLLWCFSSLGDLRSFDLNCFFELFAFGKNIVGFKMLNFLVGNIDVAMVGRLLGSSVLGVYSMALNLANLPRLKLSFIISQVAFPAFAKIQDDIAAVSAAYLKIVRFASVVNFALLTGLAVLAVPFVQVVLGERWAQLSGPLPVLCVYGMFFSVTTLVGNVYNGLGRPDYSLKFAVFNFAGTMLAILLGFRQGLIAIAVNLAVYSAFSNMIGHLFVKRLTGISYLSYLRVLVPAVSASVVMASGLLGWTAVSERVFDTTTVFSFLSSLFIGLLLYCSGLFVFSRRTFIDMAQIARGFIK
ncbi:MAG TPA: hypothetical protein DCL35_05385 [Candidatus Omnitrophica bacterium]|nr:hypothetical protein [Candidatus Omnitrophota bacterium]